MLNIAGGTNVGALVGGSGVFAGNTGGITVAHTHTFTVRSGGTNVNHSHDTTISGATVAAGSDSAHNNIQPTIICNKIIKI